MRRRRHFPVWVLAIALVILLGVGNTAVAQKWGKVTDEEWNLTPPPQMPEADAVVLFDIGQCEITRNGIIFDRHVRKKIFNKEATAEAASIEIRCWEDDKIKFVNAQTLTPDGGIIKIGRKEFFEKKSDDWLIKTFAFPAVEDGVIVEYRYRRVHRRYPWLDPWHFQSDLFTLRSTFRLLLPEHFTYNFVAINLSPAEKKPVQEVVYQDGERVTQFMWELRDLYPDIDEPHSGLKNDYRKSLYYQLESYRSAVQYEQFAEDWANIGYRVNQWFTDYADGCSAFQGIADSLCTGLTTDNEKAECLYNYVRNTYDTRDGNYSGYAHYLHDNMQQMLDTRHGRASEKNLLLMSLLRAAGLEAYPLLIGTRNFSGFSENVQQLWQFNHLICYVAENPDGYALDTGDRSIPYPYLPAYDLVYGGLLVDGKNSRSIQLFNRERKSGRDLTATFILREDGSAICSTHVSLSGHVMIGYRELQREPAKKEMIRGKILRNRDLKFDVIHAAVFRDTAADTMCFDFQLEFHNLDEHVGDNLLFTPCIFFVSKHPFSAERRQFPIDFQFSAVYKHCIKVRIPGGMKIVHVPEDISLHTEGLRYSQLVLPHTDRVEIRSTFKVTESMIRPNQYSSVREIYDAMVNAGSEKIAITHGATE